MTAIARGDPINKLTGITRPDVAELLRDPDVRRLIVAELRRLAAGIAAGGISLSEFTWEADAPPEHWRRIVLGLTCFDCAAEQAGG